MNPLANFFEEQREEVMEYLGTEPVENWELREVTSAVFFTKISGFSVWITDDFDLSRFNDWYERNFLK